MNLLWLPVVVAVALVVVAVVSEEFAMTENVPFLLLEAGVPLVDSAAVLLAMVVQ